MLARLLDAAAAKAEAMAAGLSAEVFDQSPHKGNDHPVRWRGNRLEHWEIALIKAMVADGRWPNDQDSRRNNKLAD